MYTQTSDENSEQSRDQLRLLHSRIYGRSARRSAHRASNGSRIHGASAILAIVVSHALRNAALHAEGSLIIHKISAIFAIHFLSSKIRIRVVKAANPAALRAKEREKINRICDRQISGTKRDHSGIRAFPENAPVEDEVSIQYRDNDKPRIIGKRFCRIASQKRNKRTGHSASRTRKVQKRKKRTPYRCRMHYECGGGKAQSGKNLLKGIFYFRHLRTAFRNKALSPRGDFFRFQYITPRRCCQ